MPQREAAFLTVSERAKLGAVLATAEALVGTRDGRRVGEDACAPRGDHSSAQALVEEIVAEKSKDFSLAHALCRILAEAGENAPPATLELAQILEDRLAERDLVNRVADLLAARA